MPDRPGVFENLIVVPAREGLVAEKVDLVESLVFDVAEGVGLVPA